jgi:hypothetical protein
MPAGQDPLKAPAHHTPDFFIDDSNLDVGVKAFCNLIYLYASQKKKTVSRQPLSRQWSLNYNYPGDSLLS